MVKYLSGYSGEYKLFTLSKSKETTQKVLENGLTVGELLENSLVLLPENISIDLTEKEVESFSIFSDGDILDINEKGIVYRWYSVRDGDAGVSTTPLCNSNCIMCPAGEKERSLASPLNIEPIYTVLKHMPKDLWHFTITGGEPTLVGEENFANILKAVKNELPDTKILLLTNGRTLGDKGFFEKFTQNKPANIRVAIPIHGSTPEKHDYITQAKGSFKQTLRAIANLLREKVELEIRIVVSKLNCEDVLQIAKLIVSMFPTVSVVNFVGLEMRGNCVVNADKVLISYQEAFEKSKDAIRLLIHHGIDVGLYNFPYCMIDRKYWPIAQKSISAYKSMFYDVCENCALRKECCGIFTATMNYYKPEVYPITDGDTK